MPITKSAKKSMRVSRSKRTRNINQKTKLKEILKHANEKNLSQAYSLIDKASKKHLVHKNKAARLKSSLAKKFGSTKTAAPIKKLTKSAKAKKNLKKNANK